MKNQREAMSMKHDIMDFMYCQSSTKQEERPPSDKEQNEPESPVKALQLGLTQLLTISPRQCAGRKRTSSGSFKEPAFGDAIGDSAQILAADDTSRFRDLTRADTTFNSESTIVTKGPDTDCTRQNQLDTTSTDLTSFPTFTRGTPKKRERKHRRHPSLLSWKDESRFELEIR